ncbi:MAG: ribulose-phosphate 3-epimerase [Candidatus Neomarinimicrobiota bacterium]|nr:ribulose-phosphate 3-epimerase [Candidatus Neomarinimicrobiota bacterium]
MRIISPSLLSANFANVKKDIEAVENAGANRLHLDVMDGHFVPSLTFGPMIISHIREITKSHLETHLMIKNPHESIDQYIEAGSDTIIFHHEASSDPLRDINHIKNKNVLAGIAINPNTDESLLEPLLDELDYILIMSVYPGKGGQSFIEETLNKMKKLNHMRGQRKITLGVDGGVNLSTIDRVYETNVDITIVGSGLFKAEDVNKRFEELMHE